uniref:ubiquitinyl hydrolase 1 n=1 Tax=Heterorhabditis bacteriophora TaxID=37862 RepID=A0A1I7WUP4_HETBA
MEYSRIYIVEVLLIVCLMVSLVIFTKCFVFQGANASSQLEKEISGEPFSGNEHYYGLVNSGNQKENLVTCLADLFHNIATQKRRVGTIAPKRFITKLKKENELFDNYMQQDAHEFLNYLLNTISETLIEEKSADKEKIHRTGTFRKGTISSDKGKDESEKVGFASIRKHYYFTDISFFKRVIFHLFLEIFLFKYMDQLSRYTKLSYRVLFPLELRLFNVSDDASNADRLYDLVAAVVHCGATPNRGHYITVVKSNSFWLLFDDDIVDKMDITSMEDFFGLSDGGLQKNSESAYILFYQARDSSDLLKTSSSSHSNHASI